MENLSTLPALQAIRQHSESGLSLLAQTEFSMASDSHGAAHSELASATPMLSLASAASGVTAMMPLLASEMAA
jgi:hypothetical protein